MGSKIEANKNENFFHLFFLKIIKNKEEKAEVLPFHLRTVFHLLIFCRLTLNK